MCGIAGILAPNLRPDGRAKDLRDLTRMTELLAHRGPDGFGYWQDSVAALSLGHRRLAVIDPSAAAAQPMHYLNRFTIIYNGELYNYRELKASLQSRGYRFETASDTEVVLAAFAADGAACLEQFDGMFAFAIWDAQEQRLFLARDRFGEKPLFYTQDASGRWLFASEMKAFWALGVPKEMDERQVLLFLATGLTGFPLDPELAFYQHIFQLPPASHMTISCRGNEIAEPVTTRYWDLDTRQQFSGSLDEAIEVLQAKLQQSVRLRLRADVAVGTSLSGGVDSGAIAALVKGEHQHPQGFSAIFRGFEKDEAALIDGVSTRLGIASLRVEPTAADLLANFDQILWHQEMPIGSASVVAQYQVFALAREAGVTVLLDGQGADEVFGGYPQYIHWYLQQQWRAGRWVAQRRELQQFREHQPVSWGLANYLAAYFPQAAQAQLLTRQAQQIQRIPFIHRDYLQAHHPGNLLYKPFITSLRDLLYFDTTMGRLGELLRYADRNSMAHGREVRLPYLQHELVQWVFSLPDEWRMKEGYTKWILRKAMDPLLPPTNCWQGRKVAFETPQADWLLAPAAQERLAAAKSDLVKQGILDKKILQRQTTKPANAVIDWRYWVIAGLQA